MAAANAGMVTRRSLGGQRTVTMMSAKATRMTVTSVGVGIGVTWATPSAMLFSRWSARGAAVPVR